MAEKNNATCDICGKDYYLCLSCKDTLSLHPWRVHTCSAIHYQVYQIIRGYNTNIYTKEEAREKLKNTNLHDLEDFRPHIKEIIKDILKEEVKPIIKAESTMIERVEMAKEEDSVVEITTPYRKKKYKVENE